MPLQIRRGTDAERLGITPAEGELIYTTDTQILYIGDGTTAGGNVIDTTTGNLGNLNNVDTTGAVSGNILIYDGANWILGTQSSGGGGGGVATVLNDLSDVDTSGVVNGDVIKYDGVTWGISSLPSQLSDLDDVPDHDTALNGSMLTYDSGNGTWNVGAINIEALGNVDTAGAQIGSVLKYDGSNWIIGADDNTGSGGGATTLGDLTDIDVTGAITGSTIVYNGIDWEIGVDGYSDELNDLSDVFIGGTPSDGSILVYNAANSRFEVTTAITDLSTDTAPALGGNLDMSTFDIAGSGDISTSGDVTANVMYADFHGPSFGDVFADDSTTKLVDATTQSFAGDITGSVKSSNTGNTVVDTSGVTPIYTGDVYNANGDTVFNSVTGEYVGPMSTNLISIPDVLSDGSDTKLRLNPEAGTLGLKLSSTFTDDRTNDTTTAWGKIFFEVDDTNGQKVTAMLGGGNTGLFLAHKRAGFGAELGIQPSQFCQVQEGNLKLGGFDPTERLDVDGNAVVSGFVQFGSLTTLERDALTPAFGMVIYNTTTNVFEGYQNTGGTTPQWVALS